MFVGRRFHTILCVLLLLLPASDGYASAWNPESWHGEIISGFVYAEADSAVDEFGNRTSLNTYRKRISQTYANLGLTKKLALIGTFDWQDTQIVGPGLNVAFSKPSTISAGLQYQLSRREGHAVAISASYLDGIDLPDALLTIENRDPTVELRALWGESRTWHGRNLFAELQAAARIDLEGDYAGLQTQVTLGGEPTDRVMILAKGRFTDVASGEFRTLAIARQSRWETEASLVYRFRKRDYVELGYTAILSGENTVFERGVKIGLWRKF